MSSTTSTKEVELPDPVRQQLDELDAFLQRMLDIPVDPSVSESVTVEKHRSEQSIAAGHALTTASAPPTEAPRPPATRVAEGSHVVESPPTSGPIPGAIPSYPVPVRSTDSPRMAPERRIASTSPRATPLWLWPVTSVNRAYDVPTYFLGPAGAWLRESGRTAVGWLGISLLVLAALWAAVDWLIWMW
jgi:hypothetical protein